MDSAGSFCRSPVVQCVLISSEQQYPVASCSLHEALVLVSSGLATAGSAPGSQPYQA